MERDRTLRVLLVEDNPGDVRLIETLIGDAFATVAVGRLGDAIDQLARDPSDAVLLDLGLPDSQGLDTLDRLRASASGVPIIVLTGLDDEETALVAIQRGAQDYLPKGGFDEQLLVRSVRYAVERQLTEDAARSSEHRYWSLFEQANEAVFVIQDEAIFTANPTAETLLGWSIDELAERPFADIVHPEDRGLVMDRHRRRLRGEDPPSQYEFRVLTESDESRWVQASSVRIEWQGRPGNLSLLTDVSERKLAEQRMDRLLARQVAINTLSLKLGRTSTVTETCRAIYERTRSLLDIDAFFVVLFDATENAIRPAYIHTAGIERDVADAPPIPLEEEGGAQSQVILSSEPILTGTQEEDAFTPHTGYLVHDDGRLEVSTLDSSTDVTPRGQSALLAPMTHRGEVIGVLQVQSRTRNRYTQEDLDFLCGLGSVAAIAIRNLHLRGSLEAEAERLQKGLEGIVQTVSAAAGIRDPYTAGHQRRVAELALAIGAKLGLPEAQLDGLRVAALLHDIGKLAVPAEILTKPSALTEIEFGIIQSHVDSAYRILANLEFPWPIAEVIRQHHERLDGSGYPEGLSGKAICLEARIIGVADVVEAMASHRPYRPALGLASALEEIAKHSGTRFDPTVAATCLSVFEEDGLAFTEAESGGL